MKNIKLLASIAIASLTLASCGEKLNVHNPNYFTDEEMQQYITEKPEATDQVLKGLTASLYSYIGLGNAAINGGYSNNGMYESYKAFQHICQSGDIIEGDALNAGTFTKWYQNLSSNTYWYTSQVVDNYGYYYAAVLKVGPAQKALDFLTKDYVKANPSLGYARAQALTLKALAYTELMERYTDLSDVNSETSQGWPIYDKYAYNAPVEPLSVKATWNWIMNTYAEADSLFKASGYGVDGYTSGAGDKTQLYDIDRAVCGYNYCRAALDCKRYDVVVKVGEDILKHYTSFIPAASYGMPASKLEAANKRNGVDAAHPNGTSWNAEYSAKLNGLISNDLNPETIFGNGNDDSSTQYWSVLGLNTLKNGPSGYYQMDEKLYSSMSDADCRKACVLPEKFKDLNIFTHSGTDTTWFKYDIPAYTSLKWAATCGLNQTNHDVDKTYANSSWYRSSAVLLMVAEAYAALSNDSACKNWLNKLLEARTLPGCTKMTCDNTMKGSALDMCKLQWRIEMWGEGDWAFYNRKRWNKESFTRGSNHWSTTDIPSEGWIWQIPEQERQGNPYWN